MKKAFKTGEKIWIGTFITLWVLVSTVSTFHSLDFFGLSNDNFLSWLLAIGFEIGAMASLGGMLVSKGNKTIVWMLFILLTAFQIHGNMYYAWSHAGDISEWTKLFDLVDEDPNFTKRIFAFVSGGILPLVSLGFIKSLMDYMRPKEEEKVEEVKEETKDDAVSEGVNEELEDEVKSAVTLEQQLSDIPDELVKEEIQEEIQEEIIPEAFDIPENFIGGNGDSETWSQIEGPTGEHGPIGDYVQDSFVSEDYETEEIKEEPKETVELNKKRPSTKLGDIIDNAEKTVNSIGEK